MESTATRVLKEARKVIADSSRWTKGSLFRQKSGACSDIYPALTDGLSPGETVCSMGAIWMGAAEAIRDTLDKDNRVENVEKLKPAMREATRVLNCVARHKLGKRDIDPWLSLAFAKESMGHSVVAFNDSSLTTHKEVVQLFDMAISESEKIDSGARK